MRCIDQEFRWCLLEDVDPNLQCQQFTRGKTSSQNYRGTKSRDIYLEQHNRLTDSLTMELANLKSESCPINWLSNRTYCLALDRSEWIIGASLWLRRWRNAQATSKAMPNFWRKFGFLVASVTSSISELPFSMNSRQCQYTLFQRGELVQVIYSVSYGNKLIHSWRIGYYNRRGSGYSLSEANVNEVEIRKSVMPVWRKTPLNPFVLGIYLCRQQRWPISGRNIFDLWSYFHANIGPSGSSNFLCRECMLREGSTPFSSIRLW